LNATISTATDGFGHWQIHDFSAAFRAGVADENLPLTSEGLQIGGPWPSVWPVLEWIKTTPTALFPLGENSPGLVC
jgi:hypothetical protein